MGTYIIHFDDKPWEDLDDELYYRCFEIPWFSTTKTTISRLTPYTEDSAYAHGYTEAESKYREIRDEMEKQAYQRGYETGYEDGYNEPSKGKFIQVGDEVNAPFGKAIVVNIDFFTKKIWLVYADGHGGFEYFKDAPTKTGRHFPEIAEVFAKMKETDNG